MYERESGMSERKHGEPIDGWTHIDGMTDAEIAAALQRINASEAGHIVSADPADDAPHSWGAWVWLVIFVAVAIAAAVWSYGGGM